MKQLNYTQNRPAPRRFDNPFARFILRWMQPLKSKAIRGVAAGAALMLFAVACESTQSETVPTRTMLPSTPAPTAFATEARPVMVAQAPAPTPAPVSSKVVNAPELAGNAQPADAPVTTTNTTPVISEEIPPSVPANLKISEAAEKVIKLAQSGVDESVLMAYVDKSAVRFDLDADEILYLSDLGVPSNVISAMLRHDGDDPSKALTAAANTEATQPALPANPNPPAVMTQTQPYGSPAGQGQPIEVTTNYVPNGVISQPPPQVVVQQPQTVVAQEPPQVVYAEPETVTYFYNSLTPYGSWFYVSEFGWCWQPTVAVVDHGWRPYGPRGHWMWTTDGWYWASDYSWGWAPFHYGRWHMAGARGWIWVPDRVWGPAWVAWRSSDDYCGWAPLPPAAYFRPGVGFFFHGRGVDVNFGFGLGFDAFCFTSRSHFADRHVYTHFVPRYEANRVWARSHPDNHFEIRHDRDHFVNRGFAGSVPANARPAVVRDLPGHDRAGAREHVERRGGETVVYRPPPPAPHSSSSGIAAGAAQPIRQTANGRPNWSPRDASRGPENHAQSTLPSRPEGSAPPRSNAGGGSPGANPQSPPTRQREFSRENNGQGQGRERAVGAPSTPAPAPVVTQSSTAPQRRPGESFPQRTGSTPPSNAGGPPTAAGEPRIVDRPSRAISAPTPAPAPTPTTPQRNVAESFPSRQVITSPSAATGSANAAGEPRVVERRIATPSPAPNYTPAPERGRQPADFSRAPAPSVQSAPHAAPSQPSYSVPQARPVPQNRAASQAPSGGRMGQNQQNQPNSQGRGGRRD